MRWLATLAVAAALMSPTVASGQTYTFGDWARDHGYSPGDVMPDEVDAESSRIDSLNGIGEFDWTTAPTRRLWLLDNQLSSIESGTFDGMTHLTELILGGNQLSSIEVSDFSKLTNLTMLYLGGNQLSGIKPGTFSGQTNLTVLSLVGNQLSSLEADDFSSLTNLTTLHLGGNQLSSIESGTFSEVTNLRELWLRGNQLSIIESDAFIGLANLENLNLSDNGIASIEAASFSGLPNLEALYLYDNPVLTDLELAEADFCSLKKLSVEGNLSIISVSLRNSVVNQMTLIALLEGGVDSFVGIGELDGITEMDLSGIDFVDITDLSPLYVMDDLTDLWFVNTQNVDATALDVLLDNLATIESPDTEGILYMTLLNYIDFIVAGDGLLADWDAEPGHHVEFLQLGDVNHDTDVNGLDVDPFVDVLLASRFDVAADMNGDGAVNGSDADSFVAEVVGGGITAVPEPSTLALLLIALALVGLRRISRQAVEDSR